MTTQNRTQKEFEMKTKVNNDKEVIMTTPNRTPKELVITKTEISEFKEYGKTSFTFEDSIPTYKKLLNGTINTNGDDIRLLFLECDNEVDRTMMLQRLEKMRKEEIPYEQNSYKRDWETYDERLLNPIIESFHQTLKDNPFVDRFRELEYKKDDEEEWGDEYPINMYGEEIQIPRPNTEEIEDLMKYCSTISKFIMNPNVRNQVWMKEGTWDLWEMTFWMNWTYYRPMYELWGLEIFKYYDFTINHWDELSELGKGYTKKTLVEWFIHDWKLKENHFGVPRVKSFMVDFINRNQCIDDGIIKGGKLDIPKFDDLFKRENRPKMEVQ